MMEPEITPTTELLADGYFKYLCALENLSVLHNRGTSIIFNIQIPKRGRSRNHIYKLLALGLGRQVFNIAAIKENDNDIWVKVYPNKVNNSELDEFIALINETKILSAIWQENIWQENSIVPKENLD